MPNNFEAPNLMRYVIDRVRAPRRFNYRILDTLDDRREVAICIEQDERNDALARSVALRNLLNANVEPFVRSLNRQSLPTPRNSGLVADTVAGDVADNDSEGTDVFVTISACDEAGTFTGIGHLYDLKGVYRMGIPIDDLSEAVRAADPCASMFLYDGEDYTKPFVITPGTYGPVSNADRTIYKIFVTQAVEVLFQIGAIRRAAAA